MRNDRLAIDASRAGAARKTGTEWYSYEVIRAMIALNDRPAMTLYHRSAPDIVLDGSRVHHSLIERRRLWTHVGLSQAMRHDRPAALFVPAHVIPLIHPPASIVTIHDLGFLAEPGAHPAGARRMLDLTTRWNSRVARRVIAVSGQTRDDLLDRYGVDPAKIAVVHSGVDHARFRRIEAAKVTEVTRRYGIDKPYIFFLSTVQPRKNVVRLVEAFEALDDPQLMLAVAGARGWLSRPIEERIAQSPASARIRRLGHVADADVPALYNGARVFALPSLYEGFGMGVLEAMACGCAVVTSNRSSLPEIAGDAAIMVDPLDVASIRNGILRAMSSPERERLIAAGISHAQMFDWTRTASQTLAVIEKARNDNKQTTATNSRDQAGGPG